MLIGPQIYWAPDGATGAGDAAPAVPATPAAVVPATAPVTPAADDRPRDLHGRFTKEAILKAAGLPSETPVVPAVATPATPAASTPPAETPIPAGSDADLTALDALLAQSPATPEPAAAAPATPAPIITTHEVQTVQQWAQNPEVAAEAVQAARAHAQLNNALASGDIDGALGLLAPQVVEAITERIYQQRKDEFAQRIVDEHNGVRQDPRLTILEQQLNALRQSIEGRTRNEQEAQQRQQQQRAQAEFGAKLTAYRNNLFESVGLKDSPNRVWLEGALQAEIARNPKAIANIQAGRFGDIGQKFRELYVQFRPQLTAAVSTPPSAATPASAQLMTAPAGTATSAAPDNPKEGIEDGRLTSGWWAKQKDRVKKTMAG